MKIVDTQRDAISIAKIDVQNYSCYQSVIMKQHTTQTFTINASCFHKYQLVAVQFCHPCFVVPL